MNITVTESLEVAAPAERVFDFTQDWSRRKEWDPMVVEARPVEGSDRAYRVRGKGGLRFLARYQLFRRPEAASLAMEQVFSLVVQGGGGSWRYQPRDGGTVWTQTNTLTLGGGVFGWLLAPLFRRELARGTRSAMEKAKALIEASPAR